MGSTFSASTKRVRDLVIMRERLDFLKEPLLIFGGEKRDRGLNIPETSIFTGILSKVAKTLF